MRKVPELRFDGFQREWDMGTLSDLGSVSMNRRIYKEETSEIGDVPFYKIGTFGARADSYISRDLFEEYKSKYPYPKIGDLLISASGSIGKVIEYKGEDAYYQDSNIVWLEVNEKVKNSFLKQFYETVNWNELEGSTIKRLYNKDLLRKKISYPKLSEQEKIGDLFKKIDDLIEVQEGKVSKMEDFKKSMLQKMFPKKDELVPDFRFEGFEGKWKKIATRNLGEVITGNTPSTNNDEYWSLKKKNIWITPTDIKGPTISDSQRYLSNAGFCKSKKIPAESVLITSIASIGKNTINLIPASINQQINAIIPKNYDSYFIMMGFNANLQRFKSMAGKSATQIINKSTFEDFELEVPVLQEQQKIGRFFKNLDAQIENEEKLLDSYKMMKKSLLQKMFV